MSQTKTSLMGQCISEFIGTALLVFFGLGCVAAARIAGAQLGLWEISIIWGLGVALAVYLTAGTSGAHLNPAVTVAFWLFACFERKKVIPYIVAQMLGGFFCRRCCVLYVLQFIYRLRTGQRNCTRITRKPLYCGRLLYLPCSSNLCDPRIFYRSNYCRYPRWLNFSLNR